MNDALFELLSNYKERASKLTGISSKTLSRIKAELEKEVCTSETTKRRDMCEKCINCKITHNNTPNYI